MSNAVIALLTDQFGETFYYRRSVDGNNRGITDTSDNSKLLITGQLQADMIYYIHPRSGEMFKKNGLSISNKQK